MKFVIRTAANGELYYLLIARNGRTLAMSETFTRRASVLKSIAAIIAGAASAPIIEDASVRDRRG